MNQVFRWVGYSKQAFHQKMDRQLKDQQQQLLLLPLIRQLRVEHPGVAARELYLILKPEGMGRDKFESFCFDNGLKLGKPKAYKRTTDSRGVIRFPNLIELPVVRLLAFNRKYFVSAFGWSTALVS